MVICHRHINRHVNWLYDFEAQILFIQLIPNQSVDITHIKTAIDGQIPHACICVVNPDNKLVGPLYWLILAYHRYIVSANMAVNKYQEIAVQKCPNV